MAHFAQPRQWESAASI